MSSQHPDFKWIEQLHFGNEEAYRILFDEYYQMLGVFAMKYVKDKEVAEDIVQDLMTLLWEKDTYFDSISAFHSFIYLFIRNRSINHLKHQKAELNYINYRQGESISDESEVFQVMEEEIYRIFFNVIDQLPERCKEIFKLHLAGKKENEIASQLGISLSTVKSQKQKAFQRLKERLNPLFFFLLFM